jgi:hypothetical protein
MSKKKRPGKILENFHIPAPDFGGRSVPTFSSSTDSQKPWFSHRFICQQHYCIKKCSYEQMKSAMDKLRILSDLDWATIESSPRETNGFEMISAKQIRGTIPPKFAKEKALMVFRFGGGTGPRAGRIVGVREKERFSILFVDRDYSLYDHG